MLVFDWLAQTDKINWMDPEYLNLPARMTCAEYAARLFGNTFVNFVSNFRLKGGNWLICV